MTWNLIFSHRLPWKVLLFAIFTTAVIIFKNGHLHDLEGAVGCVEKLDLANASLRDSVVGSAAPAPLHQADGLSCWVTESCSVCMVLTLVNNQDLKKQIMAYCL